MDAVLRRERVEFARYLRSSVLYFDNSAILARYQAAARRHAVSFKRDWRLDP